MSELNGLFQADNADLLTFEVEDKTFASGLFWQPLSTGAKGDGRKEALRVAEQLKANLVIWHPINPPQVGLGTLSTQGKRKIAAAAAIVSKTVSMEVSNPKAFLAAVPVPDGRWLYVAQREGILLADGDVLRSEEEVHARMLSDLSLGDWPVVFAPLHWGVPNSKERSFESFLPRKNGKIRWHMWWELKPLTVSHTRTIILALVVLALVGAGAKGFMMYKAKKAAEELARIQAEQDAALASAKMVAPWGDRPRAPDFVAACDGAFGKMNLFAGNWDLVDSVCENGTITVRWKPGANGWIDHFRAIQPTAIMPLDGKTASLTLPASVKATGEAEEALPKAAEQPLIMYGAAQKYGFKLTLRDGAMVLPMPVAAPVPTEAGGAAPVPPPAPVPGAPLPLKATGWKEYIWVATDVALPSAVIAAFDGPGMRVSKVIGNLGSQPIRFTVEGVQYVQP